MFTTRPELSGTHGMVASTHWLASQSGMAVLEDGGNAFDAAVAAGFVLQVVEPHLNGPGGDLVMIFAARDAEPTVLCGQGVAPAAADVERYRAEGLTVVPGTGLLAAAVPGATPAWLTLLRDHGTMPLSRVLRDAIGYAEAGHPVLDRVVDTVERMAATFTEHWPTSAATWLPAPHRRGLFTNPALAATYRRLVQAADGAERGAGCEAALRAWGEGFVAEAVEAFVRTPVRDSSGDDHAGVITAEDCARWQPTYEPAATISWRGTTVAKPGLWSQGPTFLQTLALLDPLLDDHDWAAPGGGSVQSVHQIAEALKLALADRDAWFGDADPAAHQTRLAALLDPDYLDRRRELIGARAGVDPDPGWLAGQQPRLPRTADPSGDHAAGGAGGGEPTLVRSSAPGEDQPRGDTCHLDVADRFGNLVSATPSGGWLQSSPTIPELGFCLGTRLQMTWLEPGLPSTLTPRRRPRTTLSPTLARLDDGRTVGFGTPGGDQQDQWPLTFWLAHRLGGLNLQEAIDRPAFNVTSMIGSFDPRGWTPAGLEIESRYRDNVVDGLRDRGHRVTISPPWSLGRISAASYDPATGILRAAANARGMQGYAVGR